jgi:hypothetical protein
LRMRQNCVWWQLRWRENRVIASQFFLIIVASGDRFAFCVFQHNLIWKRERWDTSSISQICKSCVVCDEEEEDLIGWL